MMENTISPGMKDPEEEQEHIVQEPPSVEKTKVGLTEQEIQDVYKDDPSNYRSSLDYWNNK